MTPSKRSRLRSEYSRHVEFSRMYEGSIDDYRGLGLQIKRDGEDVILLNSLRQVISRVSYHAEMSYSKAQMASVIRSRLLNCDRVFNVLANRKGGGGHKQETEKFVQHMTVTLLPVLEKLQISSSASSDPQILLFVAVRHKALRVSVLYEESLGCMTELLHSRQDEIFVPLCNAVPESPRAAEPVSTRLNIRWAGSLLKKLESISQGSILVFILYPYIGIFI